MKKSNSTDNIVLLLKKIGDRMNQPDLSSFQKVAMKSHYWHLLEKAREAHPVRKR